MTMRNTRLTAQPTLRDAGSNNQATHPAYPQPGRGPCNRGFTLLEVLVALLILAIGLLGLAALQSVSLKYNHQSYERTQATLLAYDMLDRMRANPRGNYGANPTSDPGCISASCTANQLAEHDIYHWRMAISRSLAVGAATLSVTTDTAGNPVTGSITLTWMENDIPQNLTLATRL